MKHKMKYTIFYILLFILTASGCKDKTEVEPNKWALPPLTAEGANTLGCLVNGEPFVADREVIPYMGSQWNMSVKFYNNEIIRVYSEDLDRNSNSVLLTFPFDKGIDKIRIPTSTDYGFTKFTDFSFFGGRQYSVIDSDLSWVSILAYKDNEYVSGTFQFTGVSSEGDTVRITDGRFDIALD